MLNDMKKVTIYHNNRCSKSREALSILQQENLEIEIIEYLKESLSYDKIKNIYNLLDEEDKSKFIRVKEKEYDNITNDIIDSVVKFPKLLERPIIILGNKAIIARPMDKLYNLLKEEK